MKKRVVVAISGGVDSAIAAYLLVKEGFEVIGVNLKLFSQEEDFGCCGIQGINDARNVALQLFIPFYQINCEKEFESEVIKYFCQEYLSGKTPNPCILCNKKIKFGVLFEKIKTFSADYIATGHYAKVEYDKSIKRYILRKGEDREKDQSYFLFSLSQKQLNQILFPLGEYKKTQVKEIAKELGLKVYNKAASQEICFIDKDYRKFLKAQITTNEFKPGHIIDKAGKILGEHQGIAFYTIGQRKGIGAHKRPLYVVAINKDENTITVGEEEELYRDTLIAEDVNWIGIETLNGEIEVKAKIRYKQKETAVIISPLKDKTVEVKFHQPQRAITPGQAVVFYQEDKIIGGGWIC